MPARDVLKPRVPVQLGNQPANVKAPRKPEADVGAPVAADAGPRVQDMLKQMRAGLAGEPADAKAANGPAGNGRAADGQTGNGPAGNGLAGGSQPSVAPSPGADRAALEAAANAHMTGILPAPGRLGAAVAGHQADVYEPGPRARQQPSVHELEGMLFDPKVFGSGTDRARAMTPERRQAILERALGLLPKLLKYNPRDFNNYRPGAGDHVDHAPGTVQSYLRNTAMTLMKGASASEQKRLMPLLKEIFGRLQEFESHVKPPKAAARPGRELNFRLGSQMPDHPMVLPVEA